LLLQEAARRLNSCLGEDGPAARLSGDEFLVILEDLDDNVGEASARALETAEKILAAISQPYMLGGRAIRSTASIGITFFGDRPNTVNDVLQQADIALDQAQTAGRNTVRFFAPALQVAVNARVTLEDELLLAIKNNQFVLHYQPQVNRGRTIGAEALIRWNHPTRGLLAPGEFIPLAEETGLILPLGAWVLETACKQIAAWSDRLTATEFTLAVNISARQFRHPEFVQQVLSIIERTGANPRNIELELTESMLVENIEDVVAKMTVLKAHGVRFSLDDFGTGYSSLAYLKRLPLDQLKIDRSFVLDILLDTGSGAIAQTILSLSKAMGLPTIAEGVETEEQRAFLAGLGCHSFQGFLFSRPLPLEEFEQLWLGAV
jgi:predicted signal transduction protein with EAL and GGDEF domain